MADAPGHPAADAPLLSDEQKRSLIAVARDGVEAAVRGGRPARRDVPMPAASGVFVTVKKHGELRGCLGTLHLDTDLESEVVRCASDAASRDPRFPPVAEEELPELSVEVSVLGPLEQIDPQDPAAISIGRHGLVVEQGRRRGLLLPQVAPEWGWSREQFLKQTCIKAGLAPDAWRHGATVSRFAADVFGDD